VAEVPSLGLTGVPPGDSLPPPGGEYLSGRLSLKSVGPARTTGLGVASARRPPIAMTLSQTLLKYFDWLPVTGGYFRR
jgi:hypothetical protein